MTSTSFIAFLLLTLAIVESAPTNNVARVNTNALNQASSTAPDTQDPIVKYGRDLSKNIADSIIPNILSFNNQLYNAAGTIPTYMPPGSAGLGYAIATPIRLGTLLGNALAPEIVRNMVSRPIDAVSSRISELVGSLNLTSTSNVPLRAPNPIFQRLGLPARSFRAQIPPINLGGSSINLNSLLTPDNINALSQNFGTVLQRFLATQ